MKHTNQLTEERNILLPLREVTKETLRRVVTGRIKILDHGTFELRERLIGDKIYEFDRRQYVVVSGIYKQEEGEPFFEKELIFSKINERDYSRSKRTGSVIKRKNPLEYEAYQTQFMRFLCPDRVPEFFALKRGFVSRLDSEYVPGPTLEDVLEPYFAEDFILENVHSLLCKKKLPSKSKSDGWLRTLSHYRLIDHSTEEMLTLFKSFSEIFDQISREDYLRKIETRRNFLRSERSRIYRKGEDIYKEVFERLRDPENPNRWREIWRQQDIGDRRGAIIDRYTSPEIAKRIARHLNIISVYEQLVIKRNTTNGSHQQITPGDVLQLGSMLINPFVYSDDAQQIIIDANILDHYRWMDHHDSLFGKIVDFGEMCIGPIATDYARLASHPYVPRTDEFLNPRGEIEGVDPERYHLFKLYSTMKSYALNVLIELNYPDEYAELVKNHPMRDNSIRRGIYLADIKNCLNLVKNASLDELFQKAIDT